MQALLREIQKNRGGNHDPEAAKQKKDRCTLYTYSDLKLKSISPDAHCTLSLRSCTFLFSFLRQMMKQITCATTVITQETG